MSGPIPRPAARKKSGNEDRREAVEVGGAGAHRDQRVHVRRPVTERLERAHVERSSRPRTGPASRARAGTTGSPGMAGNQGAMVIRARPTHQRDREHRRHDEPPPQVGGVPGRRLVLLGLGGGRLGHIGLMVGGRRLLDTGHVPGRIDGCDERVDRHERRVVADGGGLGGEVDVSPRRRPPPCSGSG